MIKKLFSMVAALLCVATISANDAETVTWGYYNGSQNLGAWGTSKAETYYVGMKINDASLVGSKITSIKIPLNSSTLSSCAVWIVRGELQSNSGQGISDDVNVLFGATNGWNEITLPEPYTIGEGDFYVGVTFTASATDFSPMLLMPSDLLETTYIKTARTYRKWTDLGNAPGACLPLQIIVHGNVVKNNAVSVVNVDRVFAKHGEASKAKVTVANNGSNEVTNIDWTYSVAGKTVEGHTDVIVSADFYGAQGSFNIDVPAIEENGEYEGTFTVTKVNGVTNIGSPASGTHTVKVMNVVPTKRPLMEEFTGAWCGFCPSGYIGMKLMNERHPDEFICASYHNGDGMQITENYPVSVGGFPEAYFDRNHMTDAYRGDTKRDMGIDDTWSLECKEIPPLNVDVKANLSSDNGVLTVLSDFVLCQDISDANYGIGYIITADGLHGTGSNWLQHNYYSKDYQNGAYSEMYKEGMDMFNYGAEYQFLVYDDVVIATSGKGGATISGVIPADCKEADEYHHSMTFNIADMNSNYGKKENLVQDNTRLNAIVYVYDNKTHHVLNCAKHRVTLDADSSTGIKSMRNAEIRNQDYFNLAGQRVSADNYKGIIVNGTKKYLKK
ncbi:MAG: hypothetical protein MJZ29_03050 [Bacteroidaceae bacterium]|nr:hypothetical protein [Bacteroidaceae bacterium]